MTLGETEGLLATDFREAVDIHISPSARVEAIAVGPDAFTSQYHMCIDS